MRQHPINSHVVRPVAGDHGVRPCLFDLGNVGREILDLVHVVDHVPHEKHQLGLEIEEHQERLKIMAEHLKSVQMELVHT